GTIGSSNRKDRYLPEVVGGVPGRGTPHGTELMNTEGTSSRSVHWREHISFRVRATRSEDAHVSLSKVPAIPDFLTSHPQRSCRPCARAIALPLGSPPPSPRWASAQSHACRRSSSLMCRFTVPARNGSVTPRCPATDPDRATRRSSDL